MNSADKIISLVLLAFFALRPLNAMAAVFLVDRTDDTAAANVCDDNTPNDCSLRGAIIKANTSAGADTIVLSAGDYKLTITGANEDNAATGDLDIRDDLTILGDKATTTFIDGGQFTPVLVDRLFDIPVAANVTIQNLTIVGGFLPVGQNGAGIWKRSTGTLTLTNVVFDRNVSGTHGGAIESDGGDLKLSDSTLIANVTYLPGSGMGGGIRITGGTAEIDNTTFQYNVGFHGGGVEMEGPSSLTVTNSTFSNNTATRAGGGFHQTDGLSVFTNVTFSGNSASQGGATAAEGATTTMNLTNATITDNKTTSGNGGGIRRFGGSVNLINTILAANIDSSNATPDCYGVLNSLGHNLIGNDLNCTVIASSGDQIGTSGSPIDPKVGPLSDNGGKTFTHALLKGSPAIDAGDNGVCTTTDQRSLTRPLDGNSDGTAVCDIGSYEFSHCGDGIVQSQSNEQCDIGDGAADTCASGTACVAPGQANECTCQAPQTPSGSGSGSGTGGGSTSDNGSGSGTGAGDGSTGTTSSPKSGGCSLIP